MKIEKHITALLYRRQCVIVPSFGAFLTETKSARVIAETNTFYPPKKIVSFNAYLKNNDGLLANHVALSENISYENAVEELKKQVSFWQKNLQQNSFVVLKNIGTITLNVEGNFIFEPSNEINYLTAAFGLSSFLAPDIKRDFIKSEPFTEVFKAVPSLVPVSSSTSYLKYAALVLLGLGLSTFFANNYYQNYVLEQTKTVQSEVQKEVQTKIQQATFFITTPLPKVTLAVKETEMPYHIVAGVFKNEKNAEKVQQKLSKIGYKSRKIKKNNFGLFPVVYGSYPSYSEAQKALTKIHRNHNSEAWLMIKDLK